VVRILLERIYEPIFEESSHGCASRTISAYRLAVYRPARRYAVKWWIERDMRDYFTTSNHDLLMQFLQKKIEDTRFLHLIQAMLKAG
jgi:RNA-directed DNA polymerase